MKPTISSVPHTAGRSFSLVRLADRILYPGPAGDIPPKPRQLLRGSEQLEDGQLWVSEFRSGIQLVRESTFGQSVLPIEERATGELIRLVAASMVYDPFALAASGLFDEDMLLESEGRRHALAVLASDEKKRTTFEDFVNQTLQGYWRDGARTLVVTRGHDRKQAAPPLASFTIRPPMTFEDLRVTDAFASASSRIENSNQEEFRGAAEECRLALGLDGTNYIGSCLTVDPELSRTQNSRGQGIGTHLMRSALDILFEDFGALEMLGWANVADWDRGQFYRNVGGVISPTMRGKFEHSLVRFTSDRNQVQAGRSIALSAA
jgi:ribosomal protein S18 acetylase RimI-like enzyme